MHRQLRLRVSVACLLATSGYALVTTAYSSVLYLLCAPAALLVLMFPTASRHGLNRRRYSVALFSFLFAALVGLSSVLLVPTAENAQGLAKFLLAFALASSVFVAHSFEDLAATFADSIVVLSAISLVGYLLINLQLVPIELPLVENVNGVTYRVGLIFFAFDGFLQYRNTGIFWEPGIFASMIFCGLAADAFLRERTSVTRVSVLLAALATTFSGAGAVLLGLYLLIVALKPRKNGMSGVTGLKVCLGVLVLFAFLTRLPVVQDDSSLAVFRVLEKLSDVEGLQGDRLRSPLSHLHVFVDSPLFGLGLHQSLLRYAVISPNAALTSTSAYLLSAFGIGGALFTIVPLAGILALRGLGIGPRVTLCLAYIFILNKEPHTYFTITHALTLFLTLALLERLLAARMIPGRRQVVTAPASSSERPSRPYMPEGGSA